MDGAKVLGVAEWIAEAGLAGVGEVELLNGFCERLQAMGVPLTRTMVGVDTLHPVVEGSIFRWRPGGSVAFSTYERSNSLESERRWQTSPFHYLYETQTPSIRCRLDGRPPERHFPILDELAAEGLTDYLAVFTRFGDGTMIRSIDGIFSSWSTDRAGGFEDWHIALLQQLLPHLGLAIKGIAINRIAETLVEVYLGRDAGRRVLAGNIQRGVSERIETVLWFSDLEGFTRITDTVPPDQVIPLLNDYADAIVTAIHERGGQVLKLVGDGILAVFGDGAPPELCARALDAAAGARQRVGTLNRQRHEAGLPWTRYYLGLHVGEVFYGNVGSLDRLDFTVVGPAVNEVARIAALCRSADQDVLLSSAFALAAGPVRRRLVSVGRYALRGVRRPQELFTLDPEGQGEDG